MQSLPILHQSQPSSQCSATHTRLLALRDGVLRDEVDWLATEEPLEIRVQGPGQEMVRLAVTMRTPGHDAELSVGFLYTEGLIQTRHEIVAIQAGDAQSGPAPCNVVTVHLTRSIDPTMVQRNFYTTSSCGICGKASLEQIAVHCSPVAPGPVVPQSVVVELPATLRHAQRLFTQTGGLHASGLFDERGHLISLREDVGRHNAVDKLVGQMVLGGNIPLTENILLVSGRTSLEIMQKAAMAQVPIVCAISAPSSLAVEVARRFGMTLIGFLRDRHFNIYTHPERLALDNRHQ
jgi:FdhD protein